MIKKKPREIYIALFAILIFFMFIFRIGCITHEYNNHPDEGVFVHASAALKDVLLGNGEYSEVKEYPEGSYFFYLPFQIVGHVFSRIFDINLPARLANRLGAVFYSTCGVVLGARILWYVSSSQLAVLMYCILNLFSLFQIEQSRYGTGDPITFPLLMLVVYLLIRWLDGRSDRYWYLSCFAVGVLASIKYPLAYFCILPIIALFFVFREYSQIYDMIFFGVLCIIVGFVLFSPGVVKDIGYIERVCKRELDAYIHVGNITEDGGVINHFFSIFVYWLLYADCLLAVPAFFFGIRNVKAEGRECKKSSLFFKWLVPGIALVFLVYNACVKTLFMRTLYPFFCIAMLYTSYGVELAIKSKKSRVIAVCLVVLTVLRGGSYLYAYMSSADRAEHLVACLEQARGISEIDRVVLLGTDTYFSGNIKNEELFSDAECITKNELMNNGFPLMSSGDIILTGSLEFGKAGRYFFPIKNEHLKNFIQNWEEYKAENQEGYIGQSYPQYYGYLYGFWIKGTTVSEIDFPTNYVYCVP